MERKKGGWSRMACMEMNIHWAARYPAITWGRSQYSLLPHTQTETTTDMVFAKVIMGWGGFKCFPLPTRVVKIIFLNTLEL